MVQMSCRLTSSLHLFLITITFTRLLPYAYSSMGCVDHELKALTIFRRALNDESNNLTSWDKSNNCCEWKGIACDKETGYVRELNLRSMDLSGQLDPALLQLKHLRSLDLSDNAFEGIPVPGFLGFMKDLRHLNLSISGFRGLVPPQLGNLSNLVSLDFSTYYFRRPRNSNELTAQNLLWLTNMTSLEYLDMTTVNLYNASQDWLHVIMRSCPHLVQLHLHLCHLLYIPQDLDFVNFTSLRVLDLSTNLFNSNLPRWIANISSLVSLDLTDNRFHGPIPQQFSELAQLEELVLGHGNQDLSVNCSELLGGSWSKLKVLDLSDVILSGEIPESIGNINFLTKLSLEFNGSIGSLPRTITNLVNLEFLSLFGYHTNAPLPDHLDRLKKLQVLDLDNCKLTGPIPYAIGELSSLRYLNLANNQLNGALPSSLGQLSYLYRLDISSNYLVGNVTETHFENLRNLEYLNLSSNSLAFQMPSNWLPPFQLKGIQLGSCSLGPQFPRWLRNQNHLRSLGLSNASISGRIPSWFWNFSEQLLVLNLAKNMISGKLPNPLKLQPTASAYLSSNRFEGPIPRMLREFRLFDLSKNQFSGPIPSYIAPELSGTYFLSLSNNRINGTIPSSFGNMTYVTVLDLSHNNLSGGIPSTLGVCPDLAVIDFSWNQLSGIIPETLGQLKNLQSLHLNSNLLSGTIPSSLKYCTSLETLDLGNNSFCGDVPSWIDKKFTALRILRFRSNELTGEIPPQVVSVASLQILDFAQNHLSGAIPDGLQGLIAMANQQKNNRILSYGFGSYYEESLLVSTKQQELEYTRTLSLVTCIDLSDNNLSGAIPEQLTSLSGLIVLNLSRNHFDGKIVDKIGMLEALESLDLSWNQLSGEIPSSISALHFLAYLNMSYNNFFGRIPSGNQLQTLDDPYIYIGNKGLCGPPVTKTCPNENNGPVPTNDIPGKVGEENERFWLYTFVGLGFISGFWGFCGVLLFVKSWRIAYFSFADKIQDFFSAIITEVVVSLKLFARN